jgi:hypothetical protein
MAGNSAGGIVTFPGGVGFEAAGATSMEAGGGKAPAVLKESADGIAATGADDAYEGGAVEGIGEVGE